jgi:hypothetical protein
VVYWQSLDKWSQPFPWLNERHDVLSISSDSSDYKWAAIYTSGHEKYEIADYWSDDVKESPIMIKEALALKNALSSYGSQIKNKRIETKVDNQAVVFAWKNQYSKNGILNSILKDIFQITIQNNCYLNLSYIRTSENPSDVLSGVIPSQTFCQGVIPSQTFCQGLFQVRRFQGRIQDFKLGGPHLKKLHRAEGGAKIFGIFRVKNHDFTPKKNHIFTNFRGGAPVRAPPPESAPDFVKGLFQVR